LVFEIFKNQEEFDKAFEGIEELYIDGTEIPIERSVNQDIQKNEYSGKNFIQ
jgi:hypothetical protein